MAALFALIVLVYCAYAALFIYRSSFVIDGERYFSLFDDAMISMRYARNLANGYGLVWNPEGERVEGYTNLLWTLYMAALHLLPVAQSKISLLVQGTGAVFLIGNLFLVRRLASMLPLPHPPSALVGLYAALLTAFYLPLNFYGLMGMEVSVLVFLASAAAWKALVCIKANSFSWSLYLLLGLATIIRIDMAVLFVSIWSFLLMADARNRSRNLVVGLGALGLFIGAQTAFRVLYYGDLLPNTYYLKMTGYPLFLRVSRGLYMLAKFIWYANWALFLLPLGLLVGRRDRALLLLSWIVLWQAAYSVYVGGDAWEQWGGSNRYLSVAMPLFFLLLSYAVVSGQRLLSRVAGERGLTTRHMGWGVAALMLVSLVNLNALYGPKALAEWALVVPPHDVDFNRDMVRTGLLLRDVTAPDATVAVVWAGAIPYFADRQMVDLLGKNDRVISRIPMRVSEGLSRFVNFYPGHLKWDYAYSIGNLKPDVVAQLWWAPGEAEPFLAAYRKMEWDGFTLYVRKDSARIQLDQVSH